MRTIGGLMTVAVACVLAAVAVGWCPAATAADDPPAKLPDPPAQPEDKYMGEYAGTFTPADGQAGEGAGTVVGYLDKVAGAMSWVVTLTAKPAVVVKAKAKLEDGKCVLAGDDCKGEIADGKLTASGKAGKFELKYTLRKSPTLLAKPPAGAVVLLPYEEGKPTSLAAWENTKWVILSDGSLMARGGNNLTKEKFSNFKLHVEFLCPYEPDHTGQGRANSGVYYLGKYETQVLDSFGLAPKDNECGGIYGVSAPKANACLPPGQWQTYDTVFHAAKFDADGKATSDALFDEVILNGVKVQENVKVSHVTTAGMGMGHAPNGPIMLQDHGNPVRFRNMWLVPLKDGQ